MKKIGRLLFMTAVIVVIFVEHFKNKKQIPPDRKEGGGNG